MPKWWLDACESWKNENELTLPEVAQRLRRAVGRPGPFTKSSVSRYLRREVITHEMTEAFAAAMGVPPPFLAVASAEHREWCELGRQLEQAKPEYWKLELTRLRALVAAIRAGKI